MTTHIYTPPGSRSLPRTQDIVGLGLTVLLAIGLLFVAGFSHAGGLHGVAHDQRHSIAFPCH